MEHPNKKRKHQNHLGNDSIAEFVQSDSKDLSSEPLEALDTSRVVTDPKLYHMASGDTNTSTSSSSSSSSSSSTSTSSSTPNPSSQSSSNPGDGSTRNPGGNSPGGGGGGGTNPRVTSPAKTPTAQAVHRSLCHIFRIRVTESPSSDFPYLATLAAEVNQRTPPLLTAADIDAILIERLNDLSGFQWLSYLRQSFQTTLEEQRKNSLEMHSDCMRSIVTQVWLELQNDPKELLPFLEAAPDSSTALPAELLGQLSVQFEEDMDGIIPPVVNELHQKTKSMTLQDPILAELRALTMMTFHPNITRVIVRQPNWLPSMQQPTGNVIQSMSLLGPFFQFTAQYEAPAVGNYYFPNPSQMTRPQVESAHTTIRMQMKTLQEILHRAVMNIFKGGEAPRNAMLQWFATTVYANNERSKMQFNRQITSSEGFLLNLSAVLIKLCQPFVGKDQTDKIDANYAIHNKRISFDDHTRLAVSSEQLKEWTAQSESKDSFPFVTEIFFLTYYGLHVGLIKTISIYGDFLQHLGRVQMKKEEMEKSRSSWGNSPQAPMMEMMLKRMNDQLEIFYKQKLCFDSQLLDSELLQDTLAFYAFASSWLVKLGDPEGKGLPLSDSVPRLFAVLPEFFVQDIADFCIFLLRYNRSRVDLFLLERVATFLITYIGSVHYVSNPYIRSRLAEVLYEMSPHEESSSRFAVIFERNTVAVQHLTPALIQLFVDIETTGRGGQFYEKFFVRRQIAGLMKYLRTFPAYEEALKQQDEAVFIRFINMMINDSHYLLDEVLSTLPEIRDIELAMEDRENWMRLAENVRQEREQLLQQHSRMMGTYCLLANETISLFHYLSRQVIEPFMATEMIDRIAQMLNYFLSNLAGPKSLNLKVKDPQRFHFNPRLLLSLVAETFVHFSSKEAFVEAVVRDGRSFHINEFKKASAIIRRENLLKEDAISKFEKFIEHAESVAANMEMDEEELGEIPEQFEDPIMSTLMEDPVTLPSSGKTVDRSVISRHLLSDPTDPFNRSPLSVDQLIPNTQLKQEIEEWKNSKKRNRGKQEMP